MSWLTCAYALNYVIRILDKYSNVELDISCSYCMKLKASTLLHNLKLSSTIKIEYENELHDEPWETND